MDCSVWFSQEYLAYIAAVFILFFFLLFTINLSFDGREKNGNDIVYIIVVFIGLSRVLKSIHFTLDKPQFSFTLPMRKTINDFCFHSILIDVAPIDDAV